MSQLVAASDLDFALGSAWLGIGVDANRINAKLKTCRGDSSVSTFATRTLESRFGNLLLKWEAETGFVSSIEQMVLHPAYQKIIGLGSPVITLLLREMDLRPNHFHWALNAITGEDPVLPEHQGDLELIARDWIRWGRAQGYSW